MNMAQQMKLLIPKIPATLYIEHESEEVLSLDGYLWLANQLSANIEMSVMPITLDGGQYKASATITLNERKYSAEAIAAKDDDTEDPASRAQSKALLKALILAFRPYLRAAQPESKQSLLIATQVLYRERGYDRRERLEHASAMLGKQVQSFRDLDPYELAELIVSLVSQPSSQYD